MFGLFEALTLESVMAELRARGNPKSVKAMGKFGIRTDEALGVSVPTLREIAKRVGKDHSLAIGLWKTRIHEARLLAAMVEDPRTLSVEQMDSWVEDFDSWDLCDVCCGGLFDRTPVAYVKAIEWAGRKEEFVKRAGFAMIASLAVHDKEAEDSKFKRFFPAIERGSADERNFVKKAVNWALRQIGKRNMDLNREAINVAGRISTKGTSAGRWVASDAIRELKSDAVLRRLRRPSVARASRGGRYQRYRKGRNGRRPPARSSS